MAGSLSEKSSIVIQPIEASIESLARLIFRYLRWRSF